ncbi:hypothetical protein PHJA_002439800 [Phtheirospermum japonicum]|uniref:Uncharacterized protein n=1 Tax=Phtheirospermum japonicum TaxID=374723 RepID=A0A830CVC0_9LAMI|nr:hypothetical protein PHJA_002439800 [Phtheirospermum japonicum]
MLPTRPSLQGRHSHVLVRMHRRLLRGGACEELGFCEVGNGGSGPAGQALFLVHIIWLTLLGVFAISQ